MSRRTQRAVALDLAAVVLFVAIGRRSHHADGPWLAETAKVVAPFLISLAVAWLVTRAWQRPTDPWTTGVPVCLITVVGGMLLRRFVFDRSTAMAFILVTSITLGAFLVGWRAVATSRSET